MLKKLHFYYRIYRRFGLGAIMLLVGSKFKKNKLNGIHIKGAPSDLSLSNFGPDVTTLFQIFYGHEYDINLKFTPEFIIDCGANIGLSAVFFAIRYPKATIVAIEPDKQNFFYLEKNTKQFPNVICLNKAVWSHNTIMEIKDPGTGNWGLQTVEAEKGSSNSFEAITIDQIMSDFKQERIDILKIDIEGAEKELFKAHYEYWLSKTKVIAIELHEVISEEIPAIFFNAVQPYPYKKYYKGENLICEFG